MTDLYTLRKYIKDLHSTITVGNVSVNSDNLYNILPVDVTLNTNNVNVRESPGLNGKIIKQIYLGETLFRTIQVKPIFLDNHYWVHTNLGWIANEYLTYDDFGRKTLEVPYVKQEGSGSTKYRNDCGVACVLMLLKYLGIKGSEVFTVDQLSDMTPLAVSDTGLYTRDLKSLLLQFGLFSTVRNDLTVDVLKNLINSDTPAIVLINYGYILGRQNKTDFGGHFVVVVGYDDNSMIVHDPDWTTNMGRYFKVPLEQWNKAVRYSVAPFQGLTIDK